MAKTSKMDQVEQIREKTGCSYEDAKKALDEANGDVLDAIIALEKAGKVASSATAQASTNPVSSEAFQDGPVVSEDMIRAQNAYEESTGKGAFKKDLDNLWDWIKTAFSKSWEIRLVGTRKGEEVFSLPLFIAIVGCLVWGALIWLLIIGLFFGFRYHFVGIEKTSFDINEMMDKAADKAEDIKEDLKKNE